MQVLSSLDYDFCRKQKGQLPHRIAALVFLEVAALIFVDERFQIGCKMPQISVCTAFVLLCHLKDSLRFRQ